MLRKTFRNDFLNHIGRFRGVAEHTEGHMENGSVIGPYQFVVGRIFVGLQAQDKQRLLGAYLAARSRSL